MALPLKKSRCGYIIVAKVWCQKKGTHIWKKTLKNLNRCLSKPKNDKKREVTSHLDNAPIYLVGYVIQKRRYFFQIRLQQGSFLVLYNWSPHFWMRRGESLQNPLRHMGMARLDQFYSCVCVDGSTGQAVLYSYVCKWFHMSRISAAFGLNSRY